MKKSKWAEKKRCILRRWKDCNKLNITLKDTPGKKALIAKEINTIKERFDLYWNEEKREFKQHLTQLSFQVWKQRPKKIFTPTKKINKKPQQTNNNKNPRNTKSFW